MAIQAQLEIISPSGEVSFLDLDPSKGVANIGRHPDNDIVLEDPRVAPFHAMLDYSQTPFRLAVLSPDAEVNVQGDRISADSPATLHGWDTIEVAGYALILVDGARPSQIAAEAAVAVAPAQTPVPATGLKGLLERAGMAPSAKPPGSAPAAQPGTGAGQAALLTAGEAPALLHSPYPDQPDEVIIAELAEREWIIDVEQTATCQVIITDGGGIVATFVVQVEGVPQSWVTIAPPEVNLNEGERTTVTVAITPPRLPASRAGTHPLAIVVTSPNYPDHRSQRSATLTLNPYYDFAVGELSPRQQSVGGRRPVGNTVFSVANLGNSQAPFRFEARDDERACNFEFKLPGESATLAHQVEMRLPPAETVAIPIRITPLAPRLVGLRSRLHSYTVTATLLEGQQTPRSLLGQIKVRPLIGAGLLALFALLCVLAIVLVFRPRVYEFVAEPRAIMAGEEVVLNWRTSRFSSPVLESETGAVLTPLEDSTGTMVVYPADDETYTIRAENFLSQFIPPLGRLHDTQAEQQIVVDPVYPLIRVFSVDRDSILAGESVFLRWEVLNADEVILAANGNEEKLLSTEHVSERRLTPLQNPTNYTLRATNRYGFDTDSLQVTVLEPTPTPLPLPVIRRFNVEPLTVTEGQTVTLEWEVESATWVMISNLNQQYPPIGNTLHVPPATTDYVLTAYYEVEGKSVSTVGFPVTVIVNPKPTPTPEPQKPEISYFTADPVQVVKGSATTVKLLWLVTGETTNIEISGPSLGTPFSNLAPNGQLLVSVEDATSFNLVAYNGDLNASKTVQLTSVDPTAVPPPLPVIDYFTLDESSPNVTRLTSDPTTQAIRYRVAGGSTVNFVWSAQYASSVSLWADGVNLGQYAPVSSGTPRIILGPAQYQLSAENAVGDITYAYIYVSLEPVVPPPSPYNIGGQQLGPNRPLTITWAFNPGSYEGEIPGFRIYRAEVPYTDYYDFSLVADETQVTGVQPYQWVEPGMVCDRAYFLRAVYKDEFGENQVTGPSDIWHAHPCP